LAYISGLRAGLGRGAGGLPCLVSWAVGRTVRVGTAANAGTDMMEWILGRMN
jgi:hypothetical protein